MEKLKLLTKIIFSGILIAFSLSFYNIWWKVCSVIAVVKSSDFLQTRISVVGLEITGLICFILATIFIIIVILVNLFLFMKEQEKRIE